jgi:hypothetical protein
MAKSPKKTTKKAADEKGRSPRKVKVTVSDMRALAAKLRQIAGAVESLAVDMEQQHVEFVQFDGSLAGSQGVKLLTKFVNKSGSDLNDRLERV